MITNQETGTQVDEVAAGIYRICTPLDVIPGGFTFNSYLIDDDEPLPFHTGYRKLFPVTVEAIRKVMPADRLRWIGGSHFEGDEFGALNGLLAAAPEATAFGSEIGVLTSLNDYADRPARGLGDGEEFPIGGRRMQWLNTPHVPHGWDCGVLFDLSTRTLLCGDLFTLEIDDFDAAMERVAAMQVEIIMPRHRNPPSGDGGPNHWECWLRDPDGYSVVLASPDGSAG
jgi:flavorubredoxin